MEKSWYDVSSFSSYIFLTMGYIPIIFTSHEDLLFMNLTKYNLFTTFASMISHDNELQYTFQRCMKVTYFINFQPSA